MIIKNTGYEIIFAALASAFIAQVLKVLFYFMVNKKINFKVFTTTGGMPSSHSAGVLGLSTSVGIIAGYDSLVFAVALGYAIIVMYDAAGLRQAAGKTAATLNRLVREFNEHNSVQNSPYEVLKELLGHTPKQVFVGGVIGIFAAYAIHSVLCLI